MRSSSIKGRWNYWVGGTGCRASAQAGGGNESFTVVGVMEDFHYQDLTRNVEALMHHYGGKQQLGFSNLSLRIDPGP